MEKTEKDLCRRKTLLDLHVAQSFEEIVHNIDDVKETYQKR